VHDWTVFRPVRARRLKPANAQALLTVSAHRDLIHPGRPVNGIGFRRRLQALVAIGWSINQVATELGMSRQAVGVALRPGQMVMAANAACMRAVYDRLWDQSPPQDTPTRRAQVAHARRRARQRGWYPALAWDDDTIDDPGAPPDRGAIVSRQQALYEDGRELLAASYSITAAALRLGVSRDYLDKVLRRAGSSNDQRRSA
jgi:hypothetical protein